MEIEGLFFNASDFERTPKILGSGAYGTVYLAKNNKDKQQYAAKIIEVDENFDGKEQKQFLQESLILHKLDHPSIVKFHGINFKSLSNPKLLEPTILTEYLPNGSLKKILDDEKHALTKIEWTATKKYIIILGICDALRYLHNQGVVHRDLKPENILIDADYYPRVCDFGLSKCFPYSLTKSMKLTMSGKIGTPLYMAPEILRGQKQYDLSVDVYSFAMIAYEIITGKVPFSDQGEFNSPFALAAKIMSGARPKFNEFVTEKMKNLLERCWSDRPDERPTFSEIFDEISGDMSYFNETVDEDEIQDYLCMLSESKKERQPNENQKKQEKISKLEQELEKLKSKLKKCQEKCKNHEKSDEFLYSGIVSIFNDKEPKLKQAVRDLEISSSKGNGYSSFLLGLIYENGKGVENDMSKSFKYYERSFEQGIINGLRRIGYFYDVGRGVEQDYNKAKEYYERSAELGNAGAMRSLGFLYYNGYGVEQDYNKAKEYFERSSELGNSAAMFNLGVLYHNGYGVEQDYNKAKEYFERSSELGDADAMCNLGLLYANGYGVEQDYNKAKEYFERSSELGDADAMRNLGFLYAKGYGVEQDCNKAKEYFERSAELGNADAMCNLGVLYHNGDGVEQDYNKAKEYYERSAELGNADAMCNLGFLYANGDGVEQDYNKAKEYYERSAELGDAAAMRSLGVLYYNGYGVEQDYNKAKEYFERSAELGNADAAKLLQFFH